MSKFAGQMNSLKVQAWRHYYIEYDRLRAILSTFKDAKEVDTSFTPESKNHSIDGELARNRTAQVLMSMFPNETSIPRDVEHIHADFFTLFEEEIDKIERFYLGALKFFDSNMSEIVVGYYDSSSDDAHQKHLLEEIILLNTNVRQLRRFLDVNRVALRNLLHRHDKLTRCYTSKLVLEQLRNERAFYQASGLVVLEAKVGRFKNDMTKGTHKNTLF